MRRRLTMPLLLILMLFLPFGLATADDDAVREAVESAALKKALSQMAAERQQMKAALKALGERVDLLTNELMATKDRVMLLERKLAQARAHPLEDAPTERHEPTVESSSGSHPAALAGSYHLDKEHLRKAMLALAMQQVEAMIDQIPEESRAGVLEMLKTQIDLQAQKFRITLKLSTNGTFTAKGRTGSDSVDSSGTWSVSGEAITLTTTIESGATLSEPETQRGTIKGEALMMVLAENQDFTVRMVRE